MEEIKDPKTVQFDTLMCKFNDNPEYLNIMIPIIFEKTSISLRELDFTITIFSRKFPVMYKVNRSDGQSENFIMNVSYDNQLTGFKKKLFDTFKREKRIFFKIENKECLKPEVYEIIKDRDGFETTVSQLNFFYWAITNRVIDFVNENIDTIKDAMKEHNTNRKKFQNETGKRKKLLDIKYKALKKTTDTTVSFNQCN